MVLNPRALGGTLGIFAGGAWFLAMSFSLLTGWAKTAVIIIGSLHPFFDYGWGGMFAMAGQHLAYGFAAGFLFAVSYNKLLRYVSR